MNTVSLIQTNVTRVGHRGLKGIVIFRSKFVLHVVKVMVDHRDLSEENIVPSNSHQQGQ